MSHTIKNLNEVEDSGLKFGFEGVQEARFARGALDAEKTGLAYLKVMPGQRQPFAHKHDEAEEIYVILAGSGRIKLDDEVIDVQPLDAIRIAPTVTRALEGGDDGIEFIVFGPHHDNDGALVEADEFWG
jgi:mannose-6-phosphate isomerase-like protein (cupin superfamily)